MSACVVYAFLSGLSFAFLAVAYRLGQDKSVRPIVVGCAMGFFGAAAFGLQCRGQCLLAPTRVWVLALAAGVSQYVAVRLIRSALRRGPVTSFWCAASLSFLIVIVYSSAFLGEGLRGMQLAAMATGVACVVTASFTVDHAAGAFAVRRGSRLAYVIILAAILVLNGVIGSAIKDLNAQPAADGRTMLSVYCNQFYLAAFGVLGLLCLADVMASGGVKAPWKWVLPAGLLGGVSAVGGMIGLTLAASLPAAVLFTISSATSILTAAMLSVVIFREKPTPAWFVTLALSVLTLVLAQMT
jgi:drug/metabolite transporter (DMT)-like permease